MLRQEDVKEYVMKELPEADKEVKDGMHGTSVYQMMKYLVDYTNRQIQREELPVAEKCFNVVNNLYQQGNPSVRSAIENVYIYALDRVFYFCGCDKAQVLQRMPRELYSIYVRQIVGSNI